MSAHPLPGQASLFDAFDDEPAPVRPGLDWEVPAGYETPTANVLLRRSLDEAARTGLYLDPYDVAKAAWVQTRLNYEAKLTKRAPKSLKQLTVADSAARVTLYVHRKVNPDRRAFEETLLAVWDALPAEDRARLSAQFVTDLRAAKSAPREPAAA